MIKSMTGFGRASAGRGVKKIEIEIRSVNSRFLDIKFRGFHLNPETEQDIRKILDTQIIRGNIQIRIESKVQQEVQNIGFNKERFEVIQDVLKSIHVNYGQRMSLSDIISTNDLLKINEPESLNQDIIIKALEDSIKQLDKMRLAEGKEIHKDFLYRTDKLQNMIELIEKKSESYSSLKQSQMKEKISELLNGETLDESRLIQEVAYLTERADVTEEIVRCRSHFSQLIDYLNYPEPVGKRINFLVQEIGREVNTIGSKSHQPEITKYVIEMKSELEKIREQVQNIL